MTFELHAVWPMLKPGGFVLMDDIDRSDSFFSFAHEVGADHRSLIVSADDGQALIGLIQKAPPQHATTGGHPFGVPKASV